MIHFHANQRENSDSPISLGTFRDASAALRMMEYASREANAEGYTLISDGDGLQSQSRLFSKAVDVGAFVASSERTLCVWGCSCSTGETALKTT